MISNKQHTGFGASMEPCDTSTGLIRASMVCLPFALIRAIHMATTVCLLGALIRYKYCMFTWCTYKSMCLPDALIRTNEDLSATVVYLNITPF